MKGLSRVVRIGTRRSPMALAQTERVVGELRTRLPKMRVEIVEKTTSGDRWVGDLRTRGGKGDAFVKELEAALLNGEIDCAVHSMKDVPGNQALPPGLHIPGVLRRDDPRDAVVTRDGAPLSEQRLTARVGTSSIRRAAQLYDLYPALEIVPIRGNVNTRIRKLDEGEVDVLILAWAGLQRVGMASRAVELLDANEFLPAIGQGVIGIECRSSDGEMTEACALINDPDTFLCLTAERTMLRALDGHCNAPIAGCCVHGSGGLVLRGRVLSIDGRRILDTTQRGSLDEPVRLGSAAAEELLAQGAMELIANSRLPISGGGTVS